MTPADPHHPAAEVARLLREELERASRDRRFLYPTTVRNLALRAGETVRRWGYDLGSLGRLQASAVLREAMAVNQQGRPDYGTARDYEDSLARVAHRAASRREELPLLGTIREGVRPEGATP